MDSLSGDSYPEKEQKQAKEKVSNAWQNYAAAINHVAGIINQWKSGDRLGAGGGIVDMLFPQLGGIGSAIAGLVGSFRKNKPVVVDKILNPVRTLVENLSIFGAANPGSLAYTGNLATLGAGFDVNVKFQGDAKKTLAGWISQRARDENDLEGF